MFFHLPRKYNLFCGFYGAGMALALALAVVLVVSTAAGMWVDLTYMFDSKHTFRSRSGAAWAW